MNKLDDDYRICFPEKNIYISREHNWAFAAWELKKRKGELHSNSTLVHVDAHLDDVWDGLEVEGLNEMKTDYDIYKVTSSLQIDNFIWPSIGTGTIENVIYISQQSYGCDPFDFQSWDYSEKRLSPVKKIFDDSKHNGFRYWNLEEFLVDKESTQVRSLLENRDIILDLDLDYFNQKSHTNLLENNLMAEQKIIDNLTTLKELYDWSLITVSLSPIYSGGDKNALYLLGLFLGVFEIEIEKALRW